MVKINREICLEKGWMKFSPPSGFDIGKMTARRFLLLAQGLTSNGQPRKLKYVPRKARK